MKHIALYITVIVVATVAFCGCGGMNSLLQSGKPDQIYAKGMEYYKAEKWARASTLFEGCQHWYQGTPREDSLLFYNARCKYKNRDYETAASMFDGFRRKFGRSVFIEDAEGMYVLCYYYLSPGPKRDQTMTTQAIIAVNEFMSRYPNNERIESFREINKELTQRLHDKTFFNAYTYCKIGKHKSAIVALKNALKQFPTSSHREEIMYLIVTSSYKVAHNSIEKKQADRYLSMLDSYYTFQAQFPESPYLKEMEDMAKEAKDFIAKNNKDNQ
ncbi:MAG: outer membrane protein assembly factor BamD [Alistipes sp.]